MVPFLLLMAETVGPPPASIAAAVRAAVAPCRGHGRRDEVVVCGREQGESRYRLPAAVRDPGFRVDGAQDSVSRERHKLMDVGAAGTGSCSNTGAGGWTGCMVRGWRAADEQRGFRSPGDVRRAEGPGQP